MYITERKNPLGKIISGTFTHAQLSDRDKEGFIIFFPHCALADKFSGCH